MAATEAQKALQQIRQRLQALQQQLAELPLTHASRAHLTATAQQAAVPLVALEALLAASPEDDEMSNTDIHEAASFEVAAGSVLEAIPENVPEAGTISGSGTLEPANPDPTNFRSSNPGPDVDSSHLKQIEIVLRQNEARFRSTSEQLAVGMCHCDLSGRFLWVNPALCQLLGYSQEELLALTFYDITHPADLPQNGEQELLRLPPSAPACSLEKRYLRKNGEPLWSYVTISTVRDEAGNVCYLTGIVQDITALKRMEGELRASLQEKDLLLAEVHHRVNNNLQIISSLLELQAKRVQDVAARSALFSSQNRVMAMALVHEILYQSGNLVQIDFNRYIQRLVSGLLHIYDAEAVLTPQVATSVNLSISGELAIALGLILNELVTNALKHGLSQQPAGTLRVSLGAAAPDCYRLAVSHPGDWLPADFSLDRSNSMGLKLVRLLTQRIQGHLEVERGHQTTFAVQFVVKAVAANPNETNSRRMFSSAVG